jgi:hypothetical protein
MKLAAEEHDWKDSEAELHHTGSHTCAMEQCASAGKRGSGRAAASRVLPVPPPD